MDERQEQFILRIIELVLKYGIDAAIQIIKAWDVGKPSVEDIRALKDLVAPPESYEH